MSEKKPHTILNTKKMRINMKTADGYRPNLTVGILGDGYLFLIQPQEFII
jgi:hypothetical protein